MVDMDARVEAAHRLADWMRSTVPGTRRVSKAHFDVDVLAKALGAGATFRFPVIYVGGHDFTIQPGGSEVFVTHACHAPKGA